jgi:hypothetical protein
MATTALDTDCGCGGAERDTGDGSLPANPYTALQYHFGMLLGVDDLETAQAYPRGKIRLHNAWLHREGVVWGLDVGFNKRRELTVTAGLALDAAGRELHLDAIACVDLGKWYEKHKDDEGFTFNDDDSGGKTFDVHVVARFRACLARPVPAIADPCAGSELDTAFSRVSETIELLLRPGKAPAKDLGYHRLRILFSLEDDAPDYDEVKTRRDAILALAVDKQPRAYLDAFREFAALDEIDLLPQQDESGVTSSLYPEDPTEVVLADVVGIDVRPAAGVSATGWAIVDPLPAPNVRVRRSHVATATIQELLCGPLFAGLAAAPPPPQPPADATQPVNYAADAGGPRVDPASAKITSSRRISLDFSAPLSLHSVGPEQFSVTAFSSKGGWTTLDIDDVKLDAAANTVVLELKDTITTGHIIRLIARGTGPQPLLGTDHVPLAGAVGGPAGSVNDGHDFVIMLRRK